MRRNHKAELDRFVFEVIAIGLGTQSCITDEFGFSSIVE